MTLGEVRRRDYLRRRELGQTPAQARQATRRVQRLARLVRLQDLTLAEALLLLGASS